MDQGDIVAVLNEIGTRVDDVFEETFLLFSQDLPPNDLGILNPTAAVVEVELGDREYIIAQSPALLKSTRQAGTTGAVMWKVTPLVASWLASPQSILWTRDLLKPSSIVLELGCGVAGLIGLTLAPLVSSYILTDQDYIMKLLKENVAANVRPPQPKSKMKSHQKGTLDRADKLKLLTLDWERDAAQNVRQDLPEDDHIELIILCDCIYNMFLIEPLVQTCRDLCLLHPERKTPLLIAQQLRTDAVFEQWLSRLTQSFEVWRLKDEQLPSALNSASGYAIHLALLRRS